MPKGSFQSNFLLKWNQIFGMHIFKYFQRISMICVITKAKILTDLCLIGEMACVKRLRSFAIMTKHVLNFCLLEAATGSQEFALVALSKVTALISY